MSWSARRSEILVNAVSAAEKNPDAPMHPRIRTISVYGTSKRFLYSPKNNNESVSSTQTEVQYLQRKSKKKYALEFPGMTSSMTEIMIRGTLPARNKETGT
tara:strand:- start:287 stop:589 length:303 start_codon:yes stop_codon:yes gene_type:complete